MSARRIQVRSLMTLARPLAVTVAFAALVIVLLLWLGGRFSPKIDTRTADEQRTAPAGEAVAAASAPARLVRLPATETAVGTIRAVYEATITSRLAARVTEVNVRAAQHVARGEVLVRLDQSDLQARLQQAQAAVAAATAMSDHAAREEQRLRPLHEVGAASKTEYDQAASKLAAAKAEVLRAEEMVNEAQALLGYATIAAPMDGTIVDKRVEVGDTVMPGEVLLTMYDPGRMQLVASVRESLAHRLAVGQEIGVRIDVLEKVCAGEISEIVPEAESASRSFQVKVTGPCPPGVYSGMFGRLLIPLDEEEILVIPRSGVRRVGQLDLVHVIDDASGQVRRRAVRIGRAIGEDELEILSGLREGERVVLPSAETANAKGA